MRKGIIVWALALSLLLPGASVSADALGLVTADTVNVYEDSDYSNINVIGTLKNGENIAILEAFGDWYRIGYKNQTALVNVKDITTQEDIIEEYNRITVLGVQIIDYAKEFLGIPYVYGGSTPSGFDCSGFVRYVYSHFGISLPRVSYSQLNCGNPVNTDDLREGDLLFFRGGGHVGIYAGDGMYIHAPRTGRTISVDPLTRSVYAARRVF